MGRAKIISGGAEGRYLVEVDMGIERKARQLAALQAQRDATQGQIAEVNARLAVEQQKLNVLVAAQREAIRALRDAMASLEPGEIELPPLPPLPDLPDGEEPEPEPPPPEEPPPPGEEAPPTVQELLDEVTRITAEVLAQGAEMDKIRLELTPLELKLAQLQRRIGELVETPAALIRQAWCADYTEDAEPDRVVATLETPDEPGDVIILPGAPGHTPADGDLVARALCSPEQAFFNAAILPGLQKWRPNFRKGTVTGKYADGTLDVALDDATSSAQRLGVMMRTSLAGVPVEYMDCGADAFELGDRVVVKFVGRDWGNPLVIGFAANPRRCPSKTIWGWRLPNTLPNQWQLPAGLPEGVKGGLVYRRYERDGGTPYPLLEGEPAFKHQADTVPPVTRPNYWRRFTAPPTVRDGDMFVGVVLPPALHFTIPSTAVPEGVYSRRAWVRDALTPPVDSGWWVAGAAARWTPDDEMEKGGFWRILIIARPLLPSWRMRVYRWDMGQSWIELMQDFAQQDAHLQADGRQFLVLPPSQQLFPISFREDGAEGVSMLAATHNGLLNSANERVIARFVIDWDAATVQMTLHDAYSQAAQFPPNTVAGVAHVGYDGNDLVGMCFSRALSRTSTLSQGSEGGTMEIYHARLSPDFTVAEAAGPALFAQYSGSWDNPGDGLPPVSNMTESFAMPFTWTERGAMLILRGSASSSYTGGAVATESLAMNGQWEYVDELGETLAVTNDGTANVSYSRTSPATSASPLYSMNLPYTANPLAWSIPVFWPAASIANMNGDSAILFTTPPLGFSGVPGTVNSTEFDGPAVKWRSTHGTADEMLEATGDTEFVIIGRSWPNENSVFVNATRLAVQFLPS